MAIIQGSAKSSGAGGFYPTTINQSLRFEDGDSANLSRTISTTSNKKTYTLSAWVKLGNLSINREIFTAGYPAYVFIRLTSSNELQISYWTGSTLGYNLITTQLFRDPSAWYHIVVAVDTTQATASNRVKVYINGVQVTNFSTSGYPALDYATTINTSGQTNLIGINSYNTNKFDGYMAEVHFTDGTAYTADDFGELKSGIWVSKTPSVTYGTNGFYLPFNQDTAVEGFNTVTYNGTGSTRSVTGVGFEPDLVWTKSRSATNNHNLFDSLRSGKRLRSDSTAAEASTTVTLDSDGFTLGTETESNGSGQDFVAWCWDAGSGSPVSNTDGSVTSTVKANTAYGFSIVNWTGTGATATVGHGLTQTPDCIIFKNTQETYNWSVYYGDSATNLFLNTTDGAVSSSPTWTLDSDTFTVGSWAGYNSFNRSIIAYCFHSVSGYSDFGTYTGNGLADDNGPVVTTGFKPALVIYKQSSGTGNWSMVDNTRSPEPVADNLLNPNLTNAENTSDEWIKFTDTGFQVRNTHSDQNANGATYFYMAFADTRDAAFWLDESGNNNDWTVNNLENTDVVPDSPTNNFAVLNNLENNTGASATVAYREGNLRFYLQNVGGYSVSGNFAPTSGKWYWEQYVEANGNNGYWSGLTPANLFKANAPADGIAYWAGGTIRSEGTDVATGQTTYTAGNVVGIAVDMDGGTVDFYKDGTSVYQASLPSSITDNGFKPNTTNGTNNGDQLGIYNFGQDSTFAGRTTAGGNTDANGIGDFKYAPPSGFLALCTSNLPDPVIDPAQDNTPQDHFDILTSAGTSSYSGLSFAPDFLWNKIRTAVGSNVVADVIRGDDKRLRVESTNAEDTLSGFFNLTSNGFTTTAYNSSGEDYVYWFWKAGGTGVSNTDGSITSTVSANTDSGFSIVGYTGAGGTATVGHGLSSAPEMVIVKRREVSGEQWVVWVAPIHLVNTDGYLELNTTAGDGNNGNIFTTTAPTASVFSIGNSPETNSSGLDYISYCFHSVDGFSKIGSYVGNGSTDGPFVYTGFRPKWVMVKESNSTSNWMIVDAARNTYNVLDNELYTNSTSAEATSSTTSGLFCDFTSNGFKLRTASGAANASAIFSYIYLAFAEQPFKYSNAR